MNEWTRDPPRHTQTNLSDGTHVDGHYQALPLFFEMHIRDMLEYRAI